jgi:hypothetical protein
MADSVWEALSAIGTLGAVGVALWFSVQSVRANGKAEEDRAQLAAAKMLSPLSALERKAAYLSVCFAFGESDLAEPGANVLTAMEEIEALSKTITTEDLYPLLKLPRHAAKRSAKALGLIQTSVSDIRALLDHPTWSDLKSSHKAMHYKRWWGMISEIQEHLAMAVAVCEGAAATGAPRPSPEEMYGGPSGD